MSVEVESRVYASISIHGVQIPFITDAVIAMWIVTLAVVTTVILCTRRLSLVPAGPQRAMEALITFIHHLLSGLGGASRSYAPYLCTVLLFLLFSNTIAIFNIIPSGAFWARLWDNPALADWTFALEPPTKNFNVTAFLAMLSLVVVIFSEFRYKGFRGWLRSFYQPTPVSAFVKLLDYLVRPMSLCLRLFGNILGGYISMTLLYSAIPLLLPAFVSLYFDLFDGALQAYVFVFLTTMYLAEAVEDSDTV